MEERSLEITDEQYQEATTVYRMLSSNGFCPFANKVQFESIVRSYVCAFRNAGGYRPTEYSGAFASVMEFLREQGVW